MKVYLVGGAVRDQLLKLPVKDKDWVVVGSNEKQMIAAGYQQVGKDFPVFLHPINKQEYALARTEKKQGAGYTGFTCQADETISLEEDLLRRDLTINAIAQNELGEYTDPYHGITDIQNRVLRHVSPAFVEDPLRVLRVARFAARFAHLGFTIADETLDLMQTIAKSGELDHLTPERIWLETEKALSTQSPQVYFEVLRKTQALECFFPELNALWGIPNPEKWHPEIDSGIHTMMVLEQAANLSNDLVVRFAALCHDLGKAKTPPEQWPSHRGHEKTGVGIIDNACKRLKVPNQFKELAKLTSEFHCHIHKAFELKPTTIVSLFDKTDAWRKPERFYNFVTCCIADFKGRLHFENRPYPQAEYVLEALKICQAISPQKFIEDGIQGPKIREALYNARVEQIKLYKQKSQHCD